MRSFAALILALATATAPAHAEGTDAAVPHAQTTAAPDAQGQIVFGSLSKKQIQQIIKQNQGAVKGCYEQALEKQSAIEGKVAVRFTIGATGDVLEADVAEDTVKNEQMATCIVTALKAWKFPPPKGGGKVVVTYPWKFQSKKAAK